MKKIILLFSIVVASLLLLTGCEEEATTTSSGAFLGGTQGITAEFEQFGVEEESIYSIFDSETFPIEVTIHNKGEYQLQAADVTVKLLGPSPEEFEGIPAWELSNTEIIDKKSELVPTGGEETLSFSSDAKYLSPVTGSQERTWFANIDYNYKTYLIIPEVCLKEDPTDDRVCDVQESKTFFVSGAPLTVDTVEESTSGKGIMALKIKVSNVGGGKVTKLGEDFGVRETLTYSIDDANWECKSGGKINEARLLTGSAEIICKLKEPLAEGAAPATKQVQLEIDYKYRDLIQEKLRIKESAE